MSRYVLSPAAQNDLAQIWDYTCELWNDDQAERYVREIQRAIELVADPLIGRSCDEVRVGYRRHAVGSRMVYYRLGAGGEPVDVVRILHEHMDIERYFD